MINNWKFNQFYDVVLGIFSVIMILLPKAILIPFLLLAIVVIVGVVQKKVHFQWSLLPVLFISFYVLYAVYAIWTNNPHQAGVYLENKLSFVLLPVLLSFRPVQQEFQRTVSLYLLSLVVLLILGFWSGLNCYLEKGQVQCFLASVFSYVHHPTYSSVYYTVGIALLWYGFKNKYTYYSAWIVAVLMALFSVGIFFNLSLAGLLFYLLFVAVVLVWWIYKKWGKIAAAAVIIILPITASISVNAIPYVEGEWTSAKWYAQDYFKNTEGYVENRVYPVSGSEARLVMWTVAYMEFCEHPFGVGTGNIDDYLSDRLISLGQPELAKQMYNPHNQYLQTGLEIGIIGLGVLLAIIIVGIVQGIKTRNWLLVFIALSLGFNCLFESMLQRQSGIVFYAFWMILVAIYFSKQEVTAAKTKTLE